MDKLTEGLAGYEMAGAVDGAAEDCADEREAGPGPNSTIHLQMFVRYMCRIDRQMADSQEFVFSNTCELTAEFGDDKCDFFFAISYFMIKWTS